jgi:hypothetical protein
MLIKLPTYLLSIYLPTSFLPTYQNMSYLPTSLTMSYLPIYLSSTYLSTTYLLIIYLPTYYPCTYLLIYLPTYLCIPTYLLFTYIPIYILHKQVCTFKNIGRYARVPPTHLPSQVSTYEKVEVQMLLYTLTKIFIEVQGIMLNPFGIILIYKVIWLFDSQDIAMEPKRPRFNPPYQHMLCEVCIFVYILSTCV